MKARVSGRERNANMSCEKADGKSPGIVISYAFWEIKSFVSSGFKHSYDFN